MAKFTVKSEAYVKYMMTTWQGEVTVNGKDITYRFSEDDNGATFYTLEDEGWVESSLEIEEHQIIWAAIMAWGSPEEFGSNDTEVEIDDEELEDYI
jgi:hypothetical protein